MIDDGNGGYKESTMDTFPGYEYFYNQTKSSCMDMAGKPIADSLLYNQDTKTASITVGDTSSCYLYFDNWKSEDSSEGENFAQYLINKGEMWQSGLDGDGYRYTGTSPNNYLCFGTTDKTECTTNEDKYMYRVIGVFTDSDSNTNVKLIKYQQLENNSVWDYPGNSDKEWGVSILYNRLNGESTADNYPNIFIGNENYTFLSDDKWNNLIEYYSWVATRTTSSFSSEYYRWTVDNIFADEVAHTNLDSSNSTYKIAAGKIGLMYVSDYLLASGDTTINANNLNDIDNWLNIKYNKCNPNDCLGDREWLITSVGGYRNNLSGIINVTFYAAYGIGLGAGYYTVSKENSIRPSFYLKPDASVIKGTGTINNPYILKSKSVVKSMTVDLNITKNILNISITKGTGNLNKYCINNKASINDCEWKKISGSSITYEMSKSGKYYVHVIDDAGYIAEGSIVYTFANYLKDSGKMWQSGLEGDGYRFVGTGAYTASSTPANFVCLGTGNKNTCVNNPDKLLYRIIGVFDDQVKLIKLSSLTENLSFAPGTMFVQSSDQYRNYSSSRLVSLLNSTTFLTNTDYFVSDDYRDMIDTNSKTTVTTSTYSSSGPNYYNSLTPSQIYLHENNRSSKTNTKGYWNTHNNKISVLDVSDYVLSLGDTAKSMTSGTYTNRNTLKTSWLFLGNNMYGSTSGNYTTENTTAVYGASSSSVYSTIYTWTINPSGYIYYTDKASEYATRPVFYLKKNIISRGGSGTLSDPYIIAN